MESKARFVSYEAGRYVLIGEYGMGTYVLTAGDVLELLISGRWQRAYVASGGYRGWYYITADGQSERFAVGMWARLVRLASH